MSDCIPSKSENETKEKNLPVPLHNFHGDSDSQAEWHEMAQKLLHKLSSELEQSLQAAGITDQNYEDKALEAQAKGNIELAKAIAYKYARPVEWDVLSPECYSTGWFDLTPTQSHSTFSVLPHDPIDSA